MYINLNAFSYAQRMAFITASALYCVTHTKLVLA